ncbi:hypothetical protein Tco_0089350 [Tanacetum coccineum]
MTSPPHHHHSSTLQAPPSPPCKLLPQHESSMCIKKYQGIGDRQAVVKVYGVSNWTSSGVIGERVRVMFPLMHYHDVEVVVIEMKMCLWLMCFGGSLGGFGNRGSSRGHGGLWWLMMNEEDGELVMCIWREFIGRDLFENGMNLNKFRLFQMLFKHSGQI